MNSEPKTETPVEEKAFDPRDVMPYVALHLGAIKALLTNLDVTMIAVDPENPRNCIITEGNYQHIDEAIKHAIQRQAAANQP